MQTKIKRRIRLLLKTVVAVLAIAIVSGLIYEEIGRRNDRKRNPQIGQSIDIGGRKLNNYCLCGGGPAIVFGSVACGPGASRFNKKQEKANITPPGWYDSRAEDLDGAGAYPPAPAPN